MKKKIMEWRNDEQFAHGIVVDEEHSNTFRVFRAFRG